ncbi:photosystem II protein PsbQ [Xenococcus sp. PCC 7305]|uniref:photosystem II protein PsbQ n=1 Tax=Xenococcus sp. PCC 7305 TaxID=102125 RepID=UPI0002AC401D|nr:photosystem II protein PsbQ [Xenococcus sp. PCC 7305]ELS04729.1 photosystem II protein PsbQ [Xenococcus sp. PCC 7305]
MRILRSLLSVMLVLVATVLVSCSSPTASVPEVYTPEKLQTIKIYRIPVDIAKKQVDTLSNLINDEDWTELKSVIHGPLGILRRDLRYLSEALLPEDKEQSLEISDDLFLRLENLDAAAAAKNYTNAMKAYSKAIADFDAYVKIIPNAEDIDN